MKVWYKRLLETLNQLNERMESWLSEVIEKIARAASPKSGSSA